MKLLVALALAVGLSSSGLAHAQSGAPHANPDAPQNSALKDPHSQKAGSPAAGRNSFTMGQAREHIEKAGFTGVTGLMKDHDGLWQGRARKDGRRVHVAMDFQGNVTSR